MSGKRLLGIDEAGRGCVIGPLVIAGVLIEKDKLNALTKIGVKDSKRLTRRRREELLPAIQALAARVYSVALPAEALVANLNDMELVTMADIITELKPDEAYIDIPVNPKGISKYCTALRERLKAHFNDKAIKLIGENGADARYPIVGAASIVAKVQRDQAIAALREKYGDFGWGYPSEPKTQEFLRDYFQGHGKFPNFVRQRWRTVQRLLHAQKSFAF